MKQQKNVHTNNSENQGSNKNMNKTSSTAFKSMGNTRTNFMKKSQKKFFSSPKKKMPDHKEKECKFFLIFLVELMNEALDKIENTLEVDPIINYINNYKHLKGQSFKEREAQYFPEFENVEKALKKIAIHKINKDNEKSTSDVTKEAENEHNHLLKQITNSKSKLMNEIYK